MKQQLIDLLTNDNVVVKEYSMRNNLVERPSQDNGCVEASLTGGQTITIKIVRKDLERKHLEWIAKRG